MAAKVGIWGLLPKNSSADKIHDRGGGRGIQMVSSDFAEPAIQSVQNKTDQLDKGGKIICMSDTMRNAIQIISVEKDGNDGVIVAFSDGTTGAYVVEELLGLRPCRQLGELPKDQNHTKTPTMN